MENEKDVNELVEKKRARLTFGGPGHSGEYMLNLDDFDGYKKNIPERICISLREILGNEWDVSNRGSRIEIAFIKEYGKRDDEKILEAISEVIGNEYEIEKRN